MSRISDFYLYVEETLDKYKDVAICPFSNHQCIKSDDYYCNLCEISMNKYLEMIGNEN